MPAPPCSTASTWPAPMYIQEWQRWQSAPGATSRWRTRQDGNEYRISVGGAAHPRGQGVPRRHDRQPVDPLGLRQGRPGPGRLPLGLDARSGRGRRRADGGAGDRGHRTRLALPAGHPGSRRALAAEHVARRHTLLERRPDGRDRLPAPADFDGLARRDPRCRPVYTASGQWSGRPPATSCATAR